MCALLGDALGVPYEFNPASALPLREQLEMTPPHGFKRSHRAAPVGTWSDDGALLLSLLDSLTARKTLDLDDFGHRMCTWYQSGKYTPDGKVFDIGLQTQKSLQLLHDGRSPLTTGGMDESSNGNGSLMRVLSVAFLHISPSEIVRMARLQSLPTHAHPLSQLCCALYALLVHNLLLGAAPLSALQRAAFQLRRDTPAHDQETLNFIVGYDHEPTGSGFVVDSFWSAWTSFVRSSSVRECLQSAVALGNDTDTTACLAGGLAGAFYGPSKLPADWIQQLRGEQVLAPYIEALNRLDLRE